MRKDSNRVLEEGKLMDYNVSNITWKVILKRDVGARARTEQTMNLEKK